MKTLNLLSKFTNLYSLSKTLRFELIPQGKTKETFVKWIEELKENEAEELKNTKNLLAQDEHRAKSYKKVKKIIDEYHKWFISNSLEDVKLDGLNDYYFIFTLSKEDKTKNEELKKAQDKLRKQIVNAFKKEKGLFNKLSGKELFKDSKDELALLKTIIPHFNKKTLERLNIHSNEEAIQLIDEFKDFTTYFSGFHENRKNMYSDEAKSTAIAFRLIHENLPRFIDNMKAFDKIKISEVKQKFSTLLENLQNILQVKNIEEMFNLEYFNDTLNQKGIDIYNHLIGGYSEDGKQKIKGLNEYINLYNQQQKEKHLRVPKLKPLYKQILSDKQTASFVIEAFEQDEEVLESIESLHQDLLKNVFKPKKGESLNSLLEHICEFDTNKIYLKNDLGLTNISKQVYGHWGIIEEAWNKHYNRQQKKAEETETFIEKRKKIFNAQKSFYNC